MYCKFHQFKYNNVIRAGEVGKFMKAEKKKTNNK